MKYYIAKSPYSVFINLYDIKIDILKNDRHTQHIEISEKLGEFILSVLQIDGTYWQKICNVT